MEKSVSEENSREKNMIKESVSKYSVLCLFCVWSLCELSAVCVCSCLTLASVCLYSTVYPCLSPNLRLHVW